MNYNQRVKPCGMDDVGTRLEHLMQLQEVWSTAFELLTVRGWHSMQEQQQAKELETALRLLSNHMQNDYSELGLARTINDLPKDATEIPDTKRIEGYDGTK